MSNERVIHDIEEYIEDKKLINKEDDMGFDDSFFELSRVHQKTLLYYVNGDIVNPYTNLKTNGNIFQSYMMAGVSNERLNKIFNHIITYDENGKLLEDFFEIADYNEYLDVQVEAMREWKKYKLHTYVEEAFKLITGDVNFKEMLRMTLVNTIQNSKNSNEKMRAIKTFMDLEGYTQTKETNFINVYDKKGGKELTTTVANSSGDKHMQITNDFLKESDEYE